MTFTATLTARDAVLEILASRYGTRETERDGVMLNRDTVLWHCIMV